jgi:hypothetical protein
VEHDAARRFIWTVEAALTSGGPKTREVAGPGNRPACGAHGLPVAQLGGLANAARGFRAGDAQPVGQRSRQLAAQFLASACRPIWLISGCSSAGRRRRKTSQRASMTSRSGVVSASNDNSKARSRSASSASKTSTISSRQLEYMF